MAEELDHSSSDIPIPNQQVKAGVEAEVQDFSWVTLNFDASPSRTSHFYRQFRNSSENPHNFPKSVKWSPDGSVFAVSVDDNTLRMFDCSGSAEVTHEEEACASGDSYDAKVVVHEGESVYDYCWYPYMNTSDLTTCVLATTTRDHPIHLWDAVSGQLRCSYRAYDAMDEITAAHSLAFNPSGTKIYAGYEKTFRVFDIHRPGRDFECHPTAAAKKEGQSGILSSIAFSPYNGLIAAGSFNQTTAVYAESTMEMLYLLHGQLGGVTQVMFSKDGNYLYTGGRKDPYILCWDIRNAVEIVYKLYRSAESTNQRIMFDIEPCGRHLGTGGQDGHVHIYDLQTGYWASSFHAASDTVNGFCFHPSLPAAATSSGHRRFSMPQCDEEGFGLGEAENCASLWSFSWSSVSDYPNNVDEDTIASQTSRNQENIL